MAELIIRILAKFGFSHKLTDLVLSCISMDSAKLLLNGSIFNKVQMLRGLRQRDPLSPFLFIFYSKLPSRILLKLEREGKFHGIKI